MAHHVIYIPGLGDHRSYGQEIAVVNYWRLFGLHAHYLALGWRHREGLDTKIKRLTDMIDGLADQGHTVSLCGTSAGASAALMAYALRPNLNGVVTIAGKVNHPETISQATRDANPDFYAAMEHVQGNLQTLSRRGDLENILCVYARHDNIIPFKDSIIAGSGKHRVAGWSHSSAIFFGIIFGAPVIARFLRSRPHLFV